MDFIGFVYSQPSVICLQILGASWTALQVEDLSLQRLPSQLAELESLNEAPEQAMVRRSDDPPSGWGSPKATSCFHIFPMNRLLGR